MSENENSFVVDKGNRRILVTIERDLDCACPVEDDGDIKIAYLSRSRHTLGTEALSQPEMDSVRDRIKSGELVGLPVYAYVHSGTALSTEPFTCPWDSGQSGFVYCDADWAKNNLQDTLAVLKLAVESYAEWLNGEAYGYILEDPSGKQLDSCWGFLGFEYAKDRAEEAAEQLLAESAA